MRLPKLLAALAVTAMAFALFCANARAVTLNAGGSINYSVHLDDNTIPTPLAGSFCTVPGFCGIVGFGTGVAGTVTATVTFPIDQQVDLVLCTSDLTQGVTSTACAVGQNEIPCARTQVVNATAGTVTVTIRCDTRPASFTLFVVPNFVFTCDLSNACPGITVGGVITLSGGGGGGAGGGTVTPAGKVTGGGQVDGGTAPFSIMAIADPARYDQGHVKYAKKGAGACRAYAVTITFVSVSSDPSTRGGEAFVDGTAKVNNSSGSVPFHVHVVDGGEGTKADAFDFQASGCSTGNPTVQGNTQIHPTS
jgi:hypothetical protein